MDAGDKNDFWKDWCGPNHTFIKGPVDGWRGVKDGVIRIDKEQIPFKDWLKGLRDDRWPKAWEKFWQNEHFLGNVGF